jgi:hypothetical protein
MLWRAVQPSLARKGLAMTFNLIHVHPTGKLVYLQPHADGGCIATANPIPVPETDIPLQAMADFISDERGNMIRFSSIEVARVWIDQRDF